MKRARHSEHSGGYTMPMFAPSSDWSAPDRFPNLSSIKKIGLDMETKDPLLLEKGPGSFRKDGHPVGISLSTGDQSWYFPFAHLGGGNMPKEGVVGWFQDLLRREDLTVVGANLQYELEWLGSLGIQIKGKMIDVQLVEALLDEEALSNSLESLCVKHLGQKKDETLLREAAKAHNVDPKSGLWKLPAKYVGPYAEFDALAPLQILEKQLPLLQKEELQNIFELEMSLIPLMWEMRKQGIKVDLDRATQGSNELKKIEGKLRIEMWDLIGSDLDVWSGVVIARHCDELKIAYPRTAAGNPSFEGEWLDNQDHLFLKLISSIREVNRLRTVFIDQWITGNQIDGIIHPQWRQMATDEGGTRTGRMAAANPNPQQVPSRSEYAHLIRSCFVPHYGQWMKMDYSQQEPRILVHFAYLMKFGGADATRLAYINNPKMDIYQHLADAAHITRRNSKDLTLGRMYNMGVDKMAAKTGTTRDGAQKMIEDFDNTVPFVKEMANKCANLALERGYIKTLLGRRRHFKFWEPRDSYRMRKEAEAKGERLDLIPVRSQEQAIQKWPGKQIQRAHTGKALNSLIQGSAADMVKAAMLQTWKETKKVPIMAVHDETNNNVNNDAEVKRIHEIHENCVDMSVPIRGDVYVGDHWK